MKTITDQTRGELMFIRDKYKISDANDKALAIFFNDGVKLIYRENNLLAAFGDVHPYHEICFKCFLNKDNLDYHSIFTEFVSLLYLDEPMLEEFDSSFDKFSSYMSDNDKYDILYRYLLKLINQKTKYIHVDNLIKKGNYSYFCYSYIYQKLLSENEEDILITFLKSDLLKPRFETILINDSKTNERFNLLLKDFIYSNIYFAEGFYLSLIRPPYSNLNYIDEVFQIAAKQKYVNVMSKLSSYCKERLNYQQLTEIIIILKEGKKEYDSLLDYMLKKFSSFDVYVFYIQNIDPKLIYNKQNYIMKCAEEHSYLNEVKIFNHQNIGKVPLKELPIFSLFYLRDILNQDYYQQYQDILIKRILQNLNGNINIQDLIYLTYSLKENSYTKYLEIINLDPFKNQYLYNIQARKEYLKFLDKYHLYEKERIFAYTL